MLSTGPISHTNIQYIDFVETLSISLDWCLLFIMLIFKGVELPLCINVTLY